MAVIESITVTCRTTDDYLGNDEIDFYVDDMSGGLGNEQLIGAVSIGDGETKQFTPTAPVTVYGTYAMLVRERDLMIDDSIAVAVFDFDQSRLEFSSRPEWTSASYTFAIQLDGPAGLAPRP